MNQSNNHLDDLQLDMNTRNDQHHSTSEPASEEWSVSPKEDNSQKKGYFSILKETVAHPNMQALRAPKIDVSIRKDQLLEEFPSNTHRKIAGLRVPKINVWQRKDHLLEEFPSNKKGSINWNPLSRQSDHRSRGSRQSSNGNSGGDVKRNDDQKKTKEWHDNYDTSTKEQCNMAPSARKSSICQSQLVHGELIQQNDKCRAKRPCSTDDILSHQQDLELPPSDCSMDLSFSGSLGCDTIRRRSLLELQHSSKLLELDNARKYHGGLAPIFDN